MFNDLDVSSLWLSSARLARKSNSTHQALNAVLHASQLGDESAVIENARLLWKDGHTRKAIQVLQNAIDTNKFATQVLPTAASSSRGADANQRLITARAQLTLAKWLDNAGQTHILALREKYQQVPKTLSAWEKGHFFLGRHYKKLMESQSVLELEQQIDAHVQGELARLVIENYLRALSHGTKYLYQALPRVLNLWLDLGGSIDKAPNGRLYARELQRRRTEQLAILHKFLDKYILKLPAYMFYTALPQIVARIAHPNPEVFERLNRILVRVVEAYPKQSLWGLMGIMTTKQQSTRRERGQRVVHSLVRGVGATKVDGAGIDLRTLIRQGEKLSEQLLLACNNGRFTVNRTMTVGLRDDLGFNHNCAPCHLVVPVEKALTATLPTLTDNVKKHRAFSRDTVTIQSFLDEVLVLSSLARPRRLTARGSDGNNYMLMIKPKDDLRTDQRLMEFNGMINRSLKRDAESSRRQLYIRTYAVTPLNEECGIIEWVGGLKTLREVLLEQYRQIGKAPDYMKIKGLMRDATAKPDSIRLFTEEVLGDFPPRLPHWYIQQFPHPAVWFSARIRYTRTLAVMSMVGTILGLGDRHAENVLLEKNTGGILHVDFNCLFDKGKTFQEPERVPFRLTHNMVAAMGSHGYEGPFRACSELTLGILRQQEETLMTILEAFIYDPTLDLQKVKKTGGGQAVKPPAPGEIRLEPRSVVESIRRKVKGLLPNESIPLSVEGHVEELIKEAVSPANLSRMYIGWCPFL
jgi:serine/threonine-protein kinase ATR